jgi:hypothetical protein
MVEQITARTWVSQRASLPCMRPRWRPTEHNANHAATPKVGPFATPRGSLGAHGSGAPMYRLAAALFAATLAALASIGAPALAADSHVYLPKPSEEIAKGARKASRCLARSEN